MSGKKQNREIMSQYLSTQVLFVRTISILLIALGIATCLASIKLQSSDIGNLNAFFSWFAGLINFVLAVSTYVLTCIYNKGKSHILLTVILTLLLAFSAFMFEDSTLDIFGFMFVSAIAAISSLIVLFYVKYRLKVYEEIK